MEEMLTASAECEEIHRVVPGHGGNREPVFALLVKRTYNIRPGQPPVRSEATIPFVETDQYYDDGNPQLSQEWEDG